MELAELMFYAYCDNPEVLELTGTLTQLVVRDNIPGDLCEAGCANGAHGVVMRWNAPERKIHLFDSFEGIPVHGPQDKTWGVHHGESLKHNPRKSGGITVVQFQQCVDSMRKFIGLANIQFHRGWFIDTFPKLTDEKFALVRLDGDLYDSYKISFDYLYPRLSPGGWMIIDDWVLDGCQQAFYEYFDDIRGIELKFLNANAYFQKPI